VSRAIKLLAFVGAFSGLTVAAPARGQGPTEDQKKKNAEINKRIDDNLARVNSLRDEIEKAADLAAARKGAKDMVGPLDALDKAIQEKYNLVQGLFAQLDRLIAENEELKRKLAGKEHLEPPPCECQPACCIPCYECPPRRGWFGRHK
jgi:hypothetical protein